MQIFLQAHPSILMPFTIKPGFIMLSL